MHLAAAALGCLAAALLKACAARAASGSLLRACAARASRSPLVRRLAARVSSGTERHCSDWGTSSSPPASSEAHELADHLDSDLNALSKTGTCVPAPLDASAYEVIRAAMDIGSGQHKLCIAAMDLRTNCILRILHKEQQQVLLNHAFVQDANGKLNADVLSRSFGVLSAFKRRGLEMGASQFAGVATAVFRRAENGEQFLQRVNVELGLGLQVVTQQEEGELGFLSATSKFAQNAAIQPDAQAFAEAAFPTGAWGTALSRAPSWACAMNEGIIAWDSGGGSFQVSALVEGELRVWLGPVGDSNVTAMLLGVQGRTFCGVSHGKRTSPNPVSLEEAERLVNGLDAILPQTPDWLARLCAEPGTKVVAFGERTSLCALASQLNGDALEMSRELVWDSMLRCLNYSDAQLVDRYGDLHDEEDMAMPKLLLMHTLMTRRLRVASVHYIRTMGNCEGILRRMEMWPHQSCP